jgi:hypothetical protein
MSPMNINQAAKKFIVDSEANGVRYFTAPGRMRRRLHLPIGPEEGVSTNELTAQLKNWLSSQGLQLPDEKIKSLQLEVDNCLPRIKKETS